MAVNELRDFSYENYYKWVRFMKRKHLLFIKTLEKKI